jgi:hypothetical protein
MKAEPWSISAEDFPANGMTPEKWQLFLRYVTHGKKSPSRSNHRRQSAPISSQILL